MLASKAENFSSYSATLINGYPEVFIMSGVLFKGSWIRYVYTVGIFTTISG